MAETPASPDTPERRRAAAHEFIKAVSPSEEIGSPLDLISRRGVERPTREQIAHGRMLPNVDAALTALDGARLEGCFTHFATADERDLGFARAQLEQMRRALPPGVIPGPGPGGPEEAAQPPRSSGPYL